MPPESESDGAARLWTVLARAHHAIALYMEQSIAGLGVGLTDFAVLELLLHKGSLPMRDVARKVLLANASTTSAVDRLQRRGLVHRIACGDRRMRIVELTTEGRTIARKLFTQHARDIQALMSELSPDEQEAVRAALKRIGLKATALVANRKMLRITRETEQNTSG